MFPDPPDCRIATNYTNPIFSRGTVLRLSVSNPPSLFYTRSISVFGLGIVNIGL